jgi:hypothetical protein
MAQAHTARFLQTFHSGLTQAQRTAASDTATPTDHADTDPAAVAFVRGVRPTAPYRPAGGMAPQAREAACLECGKFHRGGASCAPAAARNDGSYETEIKGHKVRCGGGYVSEAQAKWMIDIATTRVLPAGATVESLLVRLEQGFAKFAGSQFITKYKDLPRVTPAMVEAVAPGASTEEFKAAQATRPEVADGRYAAEHEGTLKFFKVKNGRKPGFVFLDVQASDDWHSIRNPRRINEILTLIAEDELSAARRYGMELGKCSRCGRTLTDETSRAYGIGPDCRSK